MIREIYDPSVCGGSEGGFYCGLVKLAGHQIGPETGIYSTHSKSKRTLRKREQKEFRSQKTGRRRAIFGKDTAIVTMISQQLWLTALNLHNTKPTNRKSWIKEGTMILVFSNGYTH